jgi:3-oxoacyl-[acyl-carrier protein] reductase
VELGLRDRPALVAAASRGLGFACASALAQEGARVAICARTGEAATRAAGQIREETGAVVVPIQADVGTAEGAKGFVLEGADAVGGCEVLVANAGGPPPGRASELSDEAYLQAVELNFLSTVRMAREALPFMRRAGYGRIVTIGSVAIREPIPGLVLSNASRAAAAAFLKTLSREVAADAITVNLVLPGRILTDRIRELVRGRADTEEDSLRDYAAEVPMGRLGKPEELGALVAFLASERAGYITGSAIQVDGGLIRGLP